MQAFSPLFLVNRKAPLLLWLIDAKQPFVQVGGKSAIREEVFDNAACSIARTRTNVYSVYDIALSGGEPYAVWY